MDITGQDLSAALREVDDQHRSQMAGMGAQIAEFQEGEGARGLRSERSKLLSGRTGSNGLVLPVGSAVLTFRQLLSPSIATEARHASVLAGVLGKAQVPKWFRTVDSAVKAATGV